MVWMERVHKVLVFGAVYFCSDKFFETTEEIWKTRKGS